MNLRSRLQLERRHPSILDQGRWVSPPRDRLAQRPPGPAIGDALSVVPDSSIGRISSSLFPVHLVAEHPNHGAQQRQSPDTARQGTNPDAAWGDPWLQATRTKPHYVVSGLFWSTPGLLIDLRTSPEQPPESPGPAFLPASGSFLQPCHPSCLPNWHLPDAPMDFVNPFGSEDGGQTNDGPLVGMGKLLSGHTSSSSVSPDHGPANRLQVSHTDDRRIGRNTSMIQGSRREAGSGRPSGRHSASACGWLRAWSDRL